MVQAEGCRNQMPPIGEYYPPHSARGRSLTDTSEGCHESELGDRLPRSSSASSADILPPHQLCLDPRPTAQMKVHHPVKAHRGEASA